MNTSAQTRRVLRKLAVLWILVAGRLVFAQCSTGAAGNSVVTDAACSGGTTATTAYIDAAAFTSPQLDLCTNINTILKGLSAGSAAIVDARGLNIVNAAQYNPPSNILECNTNPYSGIQSNVSSVLLLPPGNIALNGSWVIPSNSRILGIAPSIPYAQVLATTLEPASNFTPNSTSNHGSPALWSGSASSVITMCGSPPCTGISIEHLIIDGGAAPPSSLNYNGIYNNGAGDQSYVNDVTIKNVSYNALFISSNGNSSGPYANGSGPYTNLNVVIGAGSCSPSCAPSCAVIMAQTRGLHGLTCIGTLGTSSTTAAAGVYIVASNNSVELIRN
jgi:hypothetical protein